MSRVRNQLFGVWLIVADEGTCIAELAFRDFPFSKDILSNIFIAVEYYGEMTVKAGSIQSIKFENIQLVLVRGNPSVMLSSPPDEDETGLVRLGVEIRRAFDATHRDEFYADRTSGMYRIRKSYLKTIADVIGPNAIKPFVAEWEVEVRPRRGDDDDRADDRFVDWSK